MKLYIIAESYSYQYRYVKIVDKLNRQIEK